MLVIGAYRFPGDEIDPREVEGLVKGVETTHWPVVAEFVAWAAVYFDLDPREDTAEVWRRFCVLAYYIERTLDDVPADQREQSRQAYRQLLMGEQPYETLDPKMIFAYSLCKKATGVLGVDGVWPVLAGLADFSEQKAKATGLIRYIWLIVQEGRLFGRCFALLLNQHAAEKPQAKQFSRWLGYITAGVALSDSAKDLAEDYKKSRTKVAPSKIKKLTLRVVGVAVLVWASLQAPPTSVRMARWYQENTAHPF